MPYLFLDYETYYDDQYSLRKLSPPEYILDPRYETIGCAAAINNEPSIWVDGPDVPSFLRQFDPDKTTTVTFNALFDNCILAWEHGFLPARMLCSMRMAAALRGHLLSSVSLANVLKTLGLGQKGTTIHNVKGLRRAEIMNDPDLWSAFQDYANNDNEGNRAIYQALAPEFPSCERKVMDRVLRCAVEPSFQVDTTMLRDHLNDLSDEQNLALIEAGADTMPNAPGWEIKLEEFASQLRSNDQFIKVLNDRGVEIAMKPSHTDPDRKIPAFAKTDAFMGELLEHEDPIVQAIATARLGLRSTIERTRGEKILKIASLPWANYRNGNPRPFPGTMPIPLRYHGAHTGRLSGEWGINMQNLPASRGNNSSKLRKALIAPPGHKVLVADLAQIECRIAAWICGENGLLKQFATGKDPYSILASKIFDFDVDKNVHKLERFIGKTGVLGLGFGCGAEKFYNMVLRQARGMGMPMGPLLEVWTQKLAQKSVDTYREVNSNIRSAWYKLGAILDTSWCGACEQTQSFGPDGVVTIGEGYVLLPNGLKMSYQVENADDEGLAYRYGKYSHRMYGPKFLENIVQALARIVVMNAALRLWDRGYKFVLQAHDELAFIVPDHDAENAKAIVISEMTRPPSWAQELPLNAEANYGLSYGDAK